MRKAISTLLWRLLAGVQEVGVPCFPTGFWENIVERKSLRKGHQTEEDGGTKLEPGRTGTLGCLFFFWFEASSTTIYIMINTSISILHSVILIKNNMRKNDYLSNLKVFGCTAYVHVLYDLHKKLMLSLINAFMLDYPLE